jgi:hypothetical protein
MRGSLLAAYAWPFVVLALAAIFVALNIAELSPFQWDKDVSQAGWLMIAGQSGYWLLMAAIVPMYFCWVPEEAQGPLLLLLSAGICGMALGATICLIVACFVGKAVGYWLCHAAASSLFAKRIVGIRV